MAFDKILAARVREFLSTKPVSVEEKKMMGGLTFMVNGKMCVGIINEDLMVRIDPSEYERVLKIDGCRPMDFTGRSLKGFVFISPEYSSNPEKFIHWINMALDYNPLAKSAKKKS